MSQSVRAEESAIRGLHVPCVKCRVPKDKLERSYVDTHTKFWRQKGGGHFSRAAQFHHRFRLPRRYCLFNSNEPNLKSVIFGKGIIALKGVITSNTFEKKCARPFRPTKVYTIIGCHRE